MASTYQDAYQSLFDQNYVQTPDGRYFLPFTASDVYQNAIRDQAINPDTGQMETRFGGGADPETNNPIYYNTADEAYNALDPGYGLRVGGTNAQHALDYNLNGLTAEQLAAMKGQYNGQNGYFVDPNRVIGRDPATTGGSKPNDNGTWQILSILAPAALGIGSLALDQAAASATSLGTEAGAGAVAPSGAEAAASAAPASGAAVPAGSGPTTTIGDVGGSVGQQSLVGNAGTDTLGANLGTSVGEGTDPLTMGQTVGTTGTGSTIGSFLNGLPAGTLPAAATLLGSSLNANAAKKAAGQQAPATDAAIGEQSREFNQIRADQAPYQTAGTNALMRASDLLGTSGNTGTPGYGDLSRKFSVADFWNDPVVQLGYQSGLDLGTKALHNAAPLTTGLDSGAALKELTKFGTDYTGQQAASAQSRFTGDQTNQFNRLAAMAGIGQTANSVDANAGINMGNNVSSLISGQGNANAAATVGAANAYGSGLSSISNWWQQQNTVNQLLPYLRNNASNGSRY